MTLIKRASNLLLLAATAGAVVGLSAAPAMAATTLKVKVSSGGSYTAKASKTVLKDGAVSVTCTSTSTTPASTTSGKVPTGTHTGTSPVKVGTAAKLAFNNCSGPLSVVHTKVENLPYAITVDSKTNAKGQTDGIIIAATVSATYTACSLIVTSSVPDSHT